MEEIKIDRIDLSNENVIHIKNGNIEYLQFRRLLEYKDIVNHAYTLGVDVNFRTAKNDGNALTKKEKELAKNSYEKICNSINIKYKDLIKANQKHTNNIKTINGKINTDSPDFNLKEYNETDGLITDKKHLVLSTTNADCILFLMFDPKKHVIANIHSGWKGTLQRISVKAIEKMKDEFESNPKDIICCICPSIRKCHFEVNKDIKEEFENEFKDLKGYEFIKETILNKKWNIDTVLINKIILERSGIKPENIIDSGLCSVCNSNVMHSFRVEKEAYGLETALIELL